MIGVFIRDSGAYRRNGIRNETGGGDYVCRQYVAIYTSLISLLTK